MILHSPVWAPADVTRSEILVASRLLDENIDLLLEVLLVEHWSNSNLLPKLSSCTRGQSLIDLCLLVGVVELEATKLVLNPLNYDLSNLIELILPGIFVTFLLHQLVYLIVFHAPRELALSHILSSNALVISL